MSSSDIIRAAPIVPCRPWPRYTLTREQWAALSPGDVTLLAFWADTAAVYALFASSTGQILLTSTAARDGEYPALSPRFPAATLPERVVRDLWGHRALGSVDQSPWLDHGRWSVTHPMAARHGPPGSPSEYTFRPAGDLMQIPMGPVFGEPAEPAHMRIHTAGKTAAAVEMRLGYAHKGILLLMRGKSPRTAARFAARLSADATVAHSVAFARATEAALETEPPARAIMLRGVMAEVERIATHLADLGAACGEPLGDRLGWHREQMMRAAQVAFGHRMMMDCVVPGGLAGDITAEGGAALDGAAGALAGELPKLTRTLQDLGEGVGVVPTQTLAAFGAAGVVGRAAGIATDARHNPGYPPYPAANPIVAASGDVASRLRLRLREVSVSLGLVRDWLGSLPAGPVGVALPSASGEGLAVAESPRGPVWHWLRLDAGLIASAFTADPSWRLWPLQEAACAGAALDDLALIDRSFACARSGVDL